MFMLIMCRVRVSVRAWALGKVCGLVGKSLDVSFPLIFIFSRSNLDLLYTAGSARS